MGNFYEENSLFTTSKASFSSQSDLWQCSGTAVSDIIATTSVGLGYVTSGMMVAFVQSSGGTVAAGLTSGTEYMVVNVTAGTSSFQVYAYGVSSAANITADSSGGYDYAYVIRGGAVVPTRNAKYAVVQVTPTSSWDGQFKFIGSQESLDSSGRLTTGNAFVPLAYQDMSASSYPAIGTTVIDSSGGTSTGYWMYRVDVSGVNNMSMRTINHVSGGITATAKLYRE